jgi:histidinol-phosphate aminotransferase
MNYIKSSLKGTKPYEPTAYKASIKLDANETKNYLFKDGFQTKEIDLSLYPDTSALSLKSKLALILNVNINQIEIGNGSSELIDLIIKTFVEPSEKILGFEPSFSMYQIYSKTNGANYIPVPSEKDLSQQIDLMISYANEFKPKLIFLCSPNNPTGYTIPELEIIRLIQSVECLVVLDEAYIEFSDSNQSLIRKINQYPNLIILRTFSKAYGLAGIRLGYMVSSESIVSNVNQVSAPYRVNQISQTIGELALSKSEEVQSFIQRIKDERKRVMNALIELNINVFPSEGNFIFIQSGINNLCEKFYQKDILIRAWNGNLKGYYRVTIGQKEENTAFLNALKEILKDE